MYRDGGFAAHVKSETPCFPEKTMTKSISASLTSEHEKFIKENCKCVKTIGDTLLLTAKENIAQRQEEMSKETIFLGHGTQNKILDCLEMVCTSIISEVAQSEV